MLVLAARPRRIEAREHGMLIEMPAGDLRLLPGPQLELAFALGRCHVNAGFRQARKPLVAMCLVDDVYALVASFDAFPHERQKNSVLFLLAREEGARV
jgi:hypothetical protein